MEISEPRVPAGGAPRTGDKGGQKWKRRCGCFSKGKVPAAQSASDAAARDAGLRNTLALQLRDCAGHGDDQRNLSSGTVGKGCAAGGSQGSPGTADADAGADDAASLGGALGNAGTQRRIVEGELAGV